MRQREKHQLLTVFCGNEIPREAWSRFVKNHPQGTVFQTPEMFDLYSGISHGKSLAIAVSEDGDEKKIKLRGVLLAEIVSNGPMFIKPLTARSIIIGGPLVDNGDDNAIVWGLLIKEYKQRLPWYVAYTEIRPVYDMTDSAQHLKLAGFSRKGHYNLINCGLECIRNGEEM